MWAEFEQNFMIIFWWIELEKRQTRLGYSPNYAMACLMESNQLKGQKRIAMQDQQRHVLVLLFILYILFTCETIPFLLNPPLVNNQYDFYFPLAHYPLIKLLSCILKSTTQV